MSKESTLLAQNPMLKGFSIPGHPDPEVPKPNQEKEKPEFEAPPAGATIKQELLWPK